MPAPVLDGPAPDATVIRYGRPRLVGAAGRRAQEEAAERWAPAHLWFGRIRQESGYAGDPPLLFDAVDAPTPWSPSAAAGTSAPGC